MFKTTLMNLHKSKNAKIPNLQQNIYDLKVLKEYIEAFYRGVETVDGKMIQIDIEHLKTLDGDHVVLIDKIIQRVELLKEDYERFELFNSRVGDMRTAR